MNFAAGPSVMPLDVLEELQKNLVDYKGKGLSMIEASHRGGMFEEMYDECLADFRIFPRWWSNAAVHDDSDELPA